MGVVSFSRIFFVCSDLESAGTYISRMFTPGLEGSGFSFTLLFIIAIGLSLHFIGHHVRTRFVDLSERMPTPARAAFWWVCLLAIINLRPLGVLPNAYFNF